MLKTKEERNLYFRIVFKILVFLEILAIAIVFFSNYFTDKQLSFDNSIELLIPLLICWLIAVIVLPILFWWVSE